MSKITRVDLWECQGIKLILNAPKANILDGEMMAEIRDHIKDIKRIKRATKLLVFEGQGDHFCFGASVKEHTKEDAPRMLEAFHGMFLDLIDLSVPTAAVVRGQCLGGGMELAIFCNWIFASKTAKFAQPEIQLGVFPPPASLILPLKLGQSYADHLCLTSESLSAEKALAIGLVQSVSDDPMVELDAFAQKHIISKSYTSLKFAVQAARTHFNEVMRTKLPVVERLYVDELMESHDANEGIQAFLEKRAPRFE